MGNSHNGNKSQTSVRSVAKSTLSGKSSQKTNNNGILNYIIRNKIIVGIVLAVATVSLSLFIVFGTGLSKKKADETVRADWERVVSSYGHARDDSLYDELPDYIDKPEKKTEEAVDKPEFVSMLEEKASFKLIDMKKSGDPYTLTYLVTAPDLKSQLKTYLEEHSKDAIDLAGMNQLLIELVEKSELKETEAEVAVYKENGEYRVSYSDEFFDAMYGGIYSFSLETIANTEIQTDDSKKEAD